MADDTTQGQGQTPEPQEPQAQEPKVYDADYVKSLRDEAKQHRLEAKAVKERLAELERAQNAQQEAKLREQNEYQKLAEQYKSQLEQMERQLTERTRETLKMRIAAEFGLPPELAARLQGTDEESMKADAETLKRFAAPAQPTQGTRPATTPAPTGGASNSTTQDILARVLGGGGNTSKLFGG